ncbi:hypothetical protein SLA2020_140190 [Shorea laevis]
MALITILFLFFLFLLGSVMRVLTLTFYRDRWSSNTQKMVRHSTENLTGSYRYSVRVGEHGYGLEIFDPVEFDKWVEQKWDKLILRASVDQGKLPVIFKSEKRGEILNEGHRIIGNSGDQWSDLLGSPTSVCSFKLPNPMYYTP